MVSCAIIACNALQFLHPNGILIGSRLSNELEKIQEAKVLQSMTAFGGIT